MTVLHLTRRGTHKGGRVLSDEGGPARRRCKRGCGLLCAAGMGLVALSGCASPATVKVRADRYSIDVQLDPKAHTLSGRTTIDMTALARGASGTLRTDFRLHPSLSVRHVTVRGATLAQWTTVAAEEAGGKHAEPSRTWRVELRAPAERWSVAFDYDGVLFQDAAAGERPGEIHNFQMRAHVGEDGIYLADGFWYPEPVRGENDEPALAHFAVAANAVAGMALVAGAETDASGAAGEGRVSWTTPYPVEKFVLVGGAHEVHRANHRGIDIAVHLKPSQAGLAEGWIEAVKRNLDRYEPLIGPYPAKEYKVVDNFFSSGFAFPTFTLLSSAVIEMGERAQTSHGYLDHEMLHCWWGNGVHVDPRDGNWCEALASYAANYYGHVLDGNVEEARRQRRNYSHFLSRLTPEKDKPLGTFGREEGADRGIGYQKGAAVFHMLARRMGQENFWAAMRTFNRDYLGRAASWADLQGVCERQSGDSLGAFFEQWVRLGGAPRLSAEEARYDADRRRLAVKLSQGAPAYELVVPLRVTHAGGEVDVSAALNRVAEEVEIPLDVVPQSVEVDPDYHVFRRVERAELIPTTSTTRGGNAFASVAPGGDVADVLRAVRDTFASSYEAEERSEYAAGAIPPGALADRCVLILGDAVRDSYVEAFLSAVEFPVRFGADGFVFENVTYGDPTDAVLCTIVHPGSATSAITVLYGNTAEALPRAAAVPMYDRSLVIFRGGAAVVRRDFERRGGVRIAN